MVDVFYPEACAGCQQPLVKNENLLCTPCLAELPRTGYQRVADNPVLQLFYGRCKLEKAMAFLNFEKGGQVQRIMHSFKYRNRPEIGLRLATLLSLEVLPCGFFDNIDLLIPIPLHPKKLKSRGYNQSEVIARGVSEVSGIPLSGEHLLRQTHSQSQTRKSRFARWRNVESIFRLNRPDELRQRHLLLIDDVITTGSTVEASADKLLQVPGCRVSLLTLAIAR